MQTPRRSAIETTIQIALGLCYAIPLNYVMLNYVAWSSLWSQAIWVTIWFTAIGWVFKFGIRRLFNWFDAEYPPGSFKLPEGIRRLILRFYP